LSHCILRSLHILGCLLEWRHNLPQIEACPFLFLSLAKVFFLGVSFKVLFLLLIETLKTCLTYGNFQRAGPILPVYVLHSHLLCAPCQKLFFQRRDFWRMCTDLLPPTLLLALLFPIVSSFPRSFSPFRSPSRLGGLLVAVWLGKELSIFLTPNAPLFLYV